ncbi:hypothetical protein PHLCEN_2v8086 [Hermanssonia centrifuga]|uniref:FCP1 homology domain-containing protein n=1 Tax=Hermanssonia centrifuga TaxID=98765 RepID=A0A2R6NVD0_9APHY|nr:hypothetical protein PHLCEN_2v8086 [Hermanssonia centrifuga]
MPYNRRDYRHNPGPWRENYHSYNDNPYYRAEQERYENAYSRNEYSPAEYTGREYYAQDRNFRPEPSSWNHHVRPPFEDDTRYQRIGYNGASTSDYLYRHSEQRSQRAPPPPPPPWRRTMLPPSEPAAMRDDRSVTPPPPRSPSPTYLALAGESQERLSSPTEERKLLILDLNGTLVHRAPAARPKNKHGPKPVDEQGRPLPRLRSVHPRPYMPAFRAYLFAPETKAWLDVMIWSSAQPHSVDDMDYPRIITVRVFIFVIRNPNGSDRILPFIETSIGEWMKLDRKVQTVKDLKTPWSKLPSLHSSSSGVDSTSSSRPGSPRISRGSPTPESQPKPNTVHSAFTTLLLDDSPRKAELQPYNHVCLPEYSAEVRARDLEILHAKQEAETQIADLDPEGSLRDQSEAADMPVFADESAESTGEGAVVGDDTHDEVPKKRKRKEKKEKNREARRLQVQADAQGAYNDTLLAVIGILEEIKMQKNVAAWIREGGLWGPDGIPADATLSAPPLPTPSSTAPSPDDGDAAQHDGDAAQHDGDAAQHDGDAAQHDADVANGEAGDDHQSKRRKRRSRKTAAAPDPDAEGVPHLAGNDSASVVSQTAELAPESAVVANLEPPSPPMWFDHPSAVEYWASRGRKILQELNIPLLHGIER